MAQVCEMPPYDGQRRIEVLALGSTLYHHASGHQSLAPDAPPLDPESTILMASAGKILTHIAVLQLVERGAIGLDDPVYKHVPELEKLEIISANTDPSTPDVKFTLRPPTKQITLRHMLTHLSGIGSGEDALTEAWDATAPPQEFADDAPAIVKMLSTPLLFEPGEGWAYGHSVHWLQLVVSRASGQTFLQYMQEHIFDALGMKNSTYLPHTREDVSSRLLQGVQRKEDGSLVPAPEGTMNGLACSISDIKTVLVDLISPKPKLLGENGVALLFEPAFALSTPALEDLRKGEEVYAATIGLVRNPIRAPVNFSCAGGLVVEQGIPQSKLPPGTLTWNGMPNLIWTMNRQKRIATLFATQLVPVDDEKAVNHMIEFLKCAWTTFG
jgi:CubicO group peptidase (beta-lactamase class C family)